MLLVFAGLGRAIAPHGCREKLPSMSLQRTGGPPASLQPLKLVVTHYRYEAYLQSLTLPFF